MMTLSVVAASDGRTSTNSNMNHPQASARLHDARHEGTHHERHPRRAPPLTAGARADTDVSHPGGSGNPGETDHGGTRTPRHPAPVVHALPNGAMAFTRPAAAQPASAESPPEPAVDLTPAEIASLKAAFDAFDEEDSGSISLADLSFIFRGLGHLTTEYTEEMIEEMVKAVDADGSGSVDFGEFLEFVRQHSGDPRSENKELLKAFHLLEVVDEDGNGTGLISVEAIRFVLMQMGVDMVESEINVLISEAKPNPDGTIDMEQFLSIFAEGH